MFVAVIDQFFGTSTFFCSNITSPDSLVIAAVRYSHSTLSYGEIPSRLKYRRNSNPFCVLVRIPFAAALSRTSSFMRAPSLYCAYLVCLRKICGFKDRTGPYAGGKKNDKIGAFSDAIALGPDRTAVHRHQVLYDAETQAKPVMPLRFFRRRLPEALEDATDTTIAVQNKDAAVGLSDSPPPKLRRGLSTTFNSLPNRRGLL